MSATTTTSAALAVLLLASAASADTLLVKKGGSYPTIQSAVNAAQPGDTIKISSGTYRENVYVPNTRSGLTVEGDGKVLIDAQPSSGDPAGPGLRVLAIDVTLRDFEIRNARATSALDGHGLELIGARARIESVEVRHCEDSAFYVKSVEAELLDCRVQACDDAVKAAGGQIRIKGLKADHVDDGIVLEGNGARIVGCDIWNASSYGVEIEGNGALVKSCDIFGTSSAAVDVKGDDARILNCKVEAAYRAFEVDGNRTLIKKNQMRRLYNDAVEVAGDKTEILDNLVQDAAGYGFDLEGNGALVAGNKVRRTWGHAVSIDGSGFSILDNDLREASDGYSSISIHGATSGLIAGNELRDNHGSGVALGQVSEGVDVLGNEAIACGYAGFKISGEAHRLEGNRASKGASDGFRVFGEAHLLKENDAVGNDGDGFDLENGGAHELRGNLAKKNGAEGIEVGSSASQIRDNVCQKNRLDLANSGNANSFVGNQFKSGGPGVAGQLD